MKAKIINVSLRLSVHLDYFLYRNISQKAEGLVGCPVIDRAFLPGRFQEKKLLKAITFTT